MQVQTSNAVVDWLLEPVDMGVRYLALRDLQNLQSGTTEIEVACRMAHEKGPIAEAFTALGCGSDPRLSNTFKLINDKRDENGRWALEFDYTGKTWGNFGEKKKPNKWVTLRAIRILQAAGI